MPSVLSVAVDRRHFIKLTAITGTTAALTACGNPENQIVRFIPEDDLVPGVATWKPSICPLCSAGCGVIARVMEGDAEVFRNGQPGVIRMALAKKLEGNPDDPISQGKLCARGQAAIQITYHPDRLDRPKKRSGERGAGQFVDITWDEAIKELSGKLDELAAANDQASLAFLTRPRRGRRFELIAQLLQSYGAKSAVTHEVFSDDVVRRANAITFGSHQLPTYDLENARYVISFGADFLGTWNSAVAHSAAYGRMRQGRGNARPKFVHVDARLSQTAANADEFVACKPGTEGLLALAIAGDETPQNASEKTGVAVATIERLKREFAANAPAVAIIGGAPLAHTNAAFHAQAVNLLNRTALGKPGGFSFVPQTAPIATRPLKEILDAAPKVLVVDDVNPVFGSPSALKVADALKRVPFIVSFGSFIDETSALADLVLPDHSFLESWVDAVPESGSSKAVPSKFGPVMRPLYDTRSTPDVLLQVARGLAKPITGLPSSFEEFLNQGPSPRTSASAKATADKQDSRPKPATPQPPSPKPASPIRWAEPVFDGDAAQYPYHFMPYASQAFYDGSLAHLPWLQEMPDPMTSAMWCSWVEINEKKARELGIAQGDLIEVTSTQGSVRAPAFLNPGIAPDAVAMPVGQGHTNFTRYASNRGVNPIAILAPTTIAETGTLAWSATRVKITRVGGPDNDSLILFGGATRERPDWTHGRGDEE
ncbi:MAG TPA: molybdopterin-dependent oxidoreductase [Vicinamibacterales bacterium]|nr:molybdopterin-dependent oxidoreductase [Vicinamibacterales bacterium]